MILKIYKKRCSIPQSFFVAITFLSIIMITASQFGCGVYRFKDVSIPDSIKVVRVRPIENKAPYINPQLAPKLTESLIRKIVTQTKLSQTNNSDNADWEINATITGYSFSTAGISNQRVNTNRLNVAVHIDIVDRKANKTNKYDVNRSFDYDGSLSLQAAEQRLESDMLRDLSDDVFNRIFSNW